MKKHKHFVITRFNLRLSWVKDKNGRNMHEEICSEKWLTDRFELFDAYCFPSMLQQDNKDFIWLCLFNEGTPQQFRDIIAQYEARFPQMVACFMGNEDMRDLIGYTKKVINKYMVGDEDILMTTNIDTDDSLHKNFIGSLHDEFKLHSKEGVYSIVNGYQYFTKQKVMLEMYYPHSHFHTLVEKYTENFETVNIKPHGNIRRYYTPVDIVTPPYWLEFIHDANLNNDLRITSRIKYSTVFRDVDLKDFGLDMKIDKSVNRRNTLLRIPPLFLKTAIKRLNRKIKKKIKD